MQIFKKSKFEWSLIIAAGLGAYGGFPEPPLWWKIMRKNELFQLFNLWLLVFAGAGFGEFFWSVVISLSIFLVMKFSDKIIRINNNKYDDEKYLTRLR